MKSQKYVNIWNLTCKSARPNFQPCLEFWKTNAKISPNNTVYLCYIWQSVYEILEMSELNKPGFHGNEYPPY